MECNSSTKQERQRRNEALQLKIQRIQQGMRAAEEHQRRLISPIRRHSSPRASSDEANHESSNGSIDVLNTARIGSDLEVSEEVSSDPAATKGAKKPPGQRQQLTCCKCDPIGRRQERRIRRRLTDAQSLILEDRLIGQVIRTKFTLYQMYAAMLMEFMTLEKLLGRTRASGFVGRALKNIFNLGRRAQQMGARLRRKNNRKAKDSKDEKKD